MSDGNPTWDETTEVSNAPSWDDTAPIESKKKVDSEPASSLSPSSPTNSPSASTSQRIKEKSPVGDSLKQKIKETFLSNPIYDNAKTRESYYSGLDRNGVDGKKAKEFGEKLVAWKPELPKLEKAVNDNPDDVYSMYQLGRASLDLGDNNKALSLFSNLASKDPNEPFYLQGLAAALQKSGDNEKAQELYQKAQSLPPSKLDLPEAEGVEDSEERRLAPLRASLQSSAAVWEHLAKPFTAPVESMDAGAKNLVKSGEAFEEGKTMLGFLKGAQGASEFLIGGMMGSPSGLVFNTAVQAGETLGVPVNVAMSLPSSVARKTMGDEAWNKLSDEAKTAWGLVDLGVTGAILHRMGGKKVDWEKFQEELKKRPPSANEIVAAAAHPDNPKAVDTHKQILDANNDLDNPDLPPDAKEAIAKTIEGKTEQLAHEIDEKANVDNLKAHQQGVNEHITDLEQTLPTLSPTGQEATKSVIDGLKKQSEEIKTAIPDEPSPTMEWEGEDVKPKNQKEYAVQEPSTESVLQHPQETVGETGGERTGVESVEQGNEIAPTQEAYSSLPRSDERVSEEEKVKGKEEAKRIAQDEYGYDHARHLLNDVKKKLGKEFKTVQEAIKDEEVKKYLDERVEQEIQKAYEERDKELKNAPRGDFKSQLIHDNFSGITEADWIRYGDKNWLDKNFRRKYINNEARPLDVQDFGQPEDIKIEPQDVVDYILDREVNKGKYKKGALDSKGDADGEVKKTVATTRLYEGEIREDVKKKLEEIGLTRKTQSFGEAELIAKKAIAELGIDTAYDAVQAGDIKGAPAAEIYNAKLEALDNEIQSEQDPVRLDELVEEQAKIINIFSKEALEGGQFSAQLANIYDKSDLGYNLTKKIEDFKKQNKGEIPKEVEEKFKSLDAELKEVKKRLAEEEKKNKERKEAKVKQRTEVADKKIKEATNKLADFILKGKTQRPSIFASASPASIVWDGAITVVAETIRAGGKVAQAVVDGLKYIQNSDWYKGLTDKEKQEAEKGFQDWYKDKDAEIKEQRILDRLQKELDKVLAGEIKIKGEKLEDSAEVKSLKDQIAKAKEEKGLVQGKGVKEAAEGKSDWQKRIDSLQKQLDDLIEGKIKEKKDKIEDSHEAKRLKDEIFKQKERLGLIQSKSTKGGEVNSELFDSGKKEQQKLDRLEKQLEKLREGKLKEFTEKTEDSAQAKKLKEEIQDLKENLGLVPSKGEPKVPKTKFDIEEKRLEKRIEELQRKIDEEDFSEKTPSPLLKNPRLTQLRAEKLRLQGEYDKEFYKNKLLNRTKAERWKDRLWNAWGLTRLLRATGEASFVGVQGLTLTIRALLRNPTVLKQAFKEGIETFKSEKKTEHFLNEIKSQDYYPELKGSKLSLTEPHAEITARDELFLSDYANMVWNTVGYPLKLVSPKAYEKFKAATPFKAFERAAVGYLDTLRVARWLDGKQMLEGQGISYESNPKAFQQMADVVNTLTARASLGIAEHPKVAAGLTKIFFSPRLWASAIKTSTPYALYHFGKMRAGANGWKPSVAQKMAISDLTTQIALTTSMVMLAKAYFDGDDDPNTGVEMNPTSSDFGKIKIGDIRVDPWGGKIQQVILFSRIMAGSVKKKDGRKVELGTPNQTPTRWELLNEMATNKLAPSPRIVKNYLGKEVKKDGTYTDNYGNPYDLSDELLNNLYPIYWENIKELEADGHDPIDNLLIFYAFFGGGVNVYTDKKKKVKKEKTEKQSNGTEDLTSEPLQSESLQPEDIK